MLGGRGNVLAHAIAYTQMFFGGAVLPWLLNTMAGILRGTGNMKLPSLLMLTSAVWQIVLGGTLGLGLGPVPQFGMRGVAAGSLIAYCISIARDGLVPVFRPRPRRFRRCRGLRIQWAMFFDILKVGAIACFSPLQSVLTISIFTHMLAKFGTAILAGYGIGARLEFLLTSIAFCVRHRLGADDRHGGRRRPHRPRPAHRLDRGGERLRLRRCDRRAWSRSFPDLWVNIFTRQRDRARRPASNICRRWRRCTPSSASPRRCISRRRARPR